MLAISKLKSELLAYKTQIAAIESIDSLLDKSNATKPLLKLLITCGDKISAHGTELADKIQHFRKDEEIDQVKNISFLLQFITVSSQFIHDYIDKHEIFSVSLKRENLTFRKTINDLRETCSDLEGELQLLMDDDFRLLMSDIGKNLSNTDF